MNTEILEKLYKELTGNTPEKLNKLTDVGSNRQYFRLTGNNCSVIGVCGNSLQENRAFLYMGNHFLSKGLPVPRIYTQSADEICYLQEDLGDQSLFKAIEKGRTTRHFSDKEINLLTDTIRILPRIQFEGAEDMDFSYCHPLSNFNRRSILWDANYFKYCFLKATKLDFNENALEDDFEKMADVLMGCEATTFMYRDFQSRNVIIKDGSPYFIDFQGGRKGPIYYDVASFLWQAKAQIPEELRMQLVDEYLEALKPYRTIAREDFLHNLRQFVLFRTLQVLGAYGFRGYFEKKKHFIESVPFAIANLRNLLKQNFEEYPYLSKILRELTELPELQPKQATDINCNNRTVNSCNNVNDSVQKDANDSVQKDVNDSAQNNASKKNIAIQATVRETVEYPAENIKKLTVRVISFSYKKGLPEDPSGNGGGYYFDCRSVHNPGRYDQYKQLTGLDLPVIKFLEEDGEITTFLNHVYALADTHVSRYLKRGFTNLMFCFGCTGGQHRSVYSAQHTAEHIHRMFGVKVEIIHRERNLKEILDATL